MQLFEAQKCLPRHSNWTGHQKGIELKCLHLSQEQQYEGVDLQMSLRFYFILKFTKNWIETSITQVISHSLEISQIEFSQIEGP